MEPMSPVWAGGFFPTEPPGKPLFYLFNKKFQLSQITLNGKNQTDKLPIYVTQCLLYLESLKHFMASSFLTFLSHTLSFQSSLLKSIFEAFFFFLHCFFSLTYFLRASQVAQW